VLLLLLLVVMLATSAAPQRRRAGLHEPADCSNQYQYQIDATPEALR